MQTELSRELLTRFLAPTDLELTAHIAMPAEGRSDTGTHDFLVLIQLPDFTSN
jgi:hypothetical protein